VPTFSDIAQIPGAQLVGLNPHEDARGRFTELFRKEWFPQRPWDDYQSNRSDSQAGVLRGLHFHLRQVDYWYVARGRIQVGLADLRRSSVSFGAIQMVELSEDEATGLYIPTGVAHGFLALTAATLIYVVDNGYDGTDEWGVAWNDPELALAWSEPSPSLSARDLSNPLLREIETSLLPP
jgi:dTDP-4-dehydrorhamnose 3,5-epimerase